MTKDTEKMLSAWHEEGQRQFNGAQLKVDRDIAKALIPPGGDWLCIAPPGAITRSILWRDKEVALINPRGDLDDATEGDIAMGMRATPIMDTALRMILVLAEDAGNLELIRKICGTAIATVMLPAPAIVEIEEDESDAGED